jgi:hypothetical protein
MNVMNAPVDCFQRLYPSISSLCNFVWVCRPGEGFCLGLAVFGDEAVDGGLQVVNGLEDAVFEPSPDELGREAF